MREINSRKVIDMEFMGESISFIASNERIKERVRNISHESSLLEALVERTRHDDVFWDIGACVGIHTFVMSQFVPYGSVVAFEPMPSNRGILSDNKSINNCDNVTICREALADKTGMKSFAIRESVQAGYGRHSFVTGDYDSIKKILIDVETGESILNKLDDIQRPNVVKIDVEGAGPLVIEGMKDILQSDECHTVVFETHEPNDIQPSHEDYGYTESEFVELIEKCGFEVSNLDARYHYIGIKNVEHTESLKVNDANVDIIKDDISMQECDAIVNSAGTTLRMGTGVAGALRSTGGEKLNEDAILKGPVDIGDAVITKGYDLNCDFVIHAASMPHYGKGESTPKSIQTALRKSLELAKENEVESIAIPFIGCGLGGVPISTGARVIRDVLNEFDMGCINSITLVAYTQEEFDVVSRIMN